MNIAGARCFACCGSIEAAAEVSFNVATNPTHSDDGETVPLYVAAPVAATTCDPAINVLVNPDPAWEICARLLHGDEGPVIDGVDPDARHKLNPVHSSFA